MNQKRRYRLIIFNGLLAALLIVLFSRRLVGLSVISGGIVSQTIAIVIIIMSIILFFYVNYRLLHENERYDRVDTYNLEQLVTPQDYIMALSSYRTKKVFLVEINAIIDQVNRFVRKQKVLITLLYQNFSNDDTLASLSQNVNNSERMLYSNVTLSLNCLSIFDEEEYETIKAKKDRTTKEEKRYQLMQERIQQVSNLQDKNEALLLEVERVLTEITRIIMSEEPNDLSKSKELINSIPGCK